MTASQEMSAAPLSSDRPHKGLRLPAVAVLASVVLFLLLVAATAATTKGAYSYPLDDPYIHLAIAEQILAGGYGVNAGEVSAAASSIIYPVLLAGGLLLGLGSHAALVVNGFALASAGWLLGRIGEEAVGVDAARRGRVRAVAIAALLATNMPGLALMGMEHTLHACAALACVLGAARYLRSGRAELWWLAAAAFSVLVRYEALALTAAVSALLAMRGRPATAALTLLCAVAVLLLFSLFLIMNGLPPLPNSVLVKGEGVAASGPAGLILSFANNLLDHLGDPNRWPLTLLAVIHGWNVVGTRSGQSSREARLASLLAALVLWGQLVIGRFGWGFRYEAPALLVGVVCLPLAFPARARAFAAGRDGAGVAVGLVVLLAGCQPWLQAMLDSPAASRNVRLQQYEMRRLAVDFVKAPVAVNDLGWVSFGNPHKVLDLWGLGSDAARRARLSDEPTADWMARLTRESDVPLAMIYEGWFGAVPPGWVRLGELAHCRGRLLSLGGRRVALFATDPRHVPELEAAVAAWAATLPRRAVYSRTTGACGPA